MIPARWQQIDKLFHSTLEYAPEKRAAFLAQECGSDAELHHEVISLVAAFEQDRSFLEAPAYEVAPEFVVESLAGLVTGQQIGPYKIMSPLATGGMGEVFLAYDSRLGRKIALKLLPSDFARDEYRVRRFAQEARAASTLSHPNVCVIHEIGQTKDGRHFIAMEYIDGITLRERISQGALPLTEALFVAEQIAAALAAAHAAGVVHRDVKPENIMLRRDGYVKVLDFGLAKLHESESGLSDSSGKTVSQVHTEPGTQMGTVRYMSPEHLRERPVDERADIWSFGVVLYEMVTGVTPFEARSRNEVIATILKRRPKFAFGDDVPVEYRNIVAKALNRSRKERYQTVDALASNLKSLRRQLPRETGVVSLPAENVVAVRDPVTTRNPLPAGGPHRRESSPYATTARWSPALTYVSRTAEHMLTEIRHHPGASVFAGVAAVLVLLLALNSTWFSNQKPPVLALPNINITQLTHAGKSVFAAISPDGKMFAHVEKKDGMQQLLVTNIATARMSVVVPPGNFKYRGLAFSRDGNYLYFTRGDEKIDAASLYQVSLPAGAPRQLLDGVDSSISFSPDGGRFTFVRFDRAAGVYSLMIANVDGTGEREIARRSVGKRLSLEGASWSPDDKSIVCGAGSWDAGYHMNLVEVEIATGQERVLGESKQWFAIYQVGWLEDKSGLVISAREQPLSPAQLWRVSYPQGKIAKITNDTIEYQGASLARGGNTIVSVQGRQVSEIWLGPAENIASARGISSRVGVSHGLGLGWTSKGKIVFSSLAGNHLNISLVDPDGSNPTQLTVNAGDNYTPCTSPDGRVIVFSSNRTGSFNIWRMNADDGSDLRQLTFSDGNFYPACSPDGRWIAFENQSNGAFSVWRIPIEGGQPEQLTDVYARMPSISPDGQFIACRYYVEAGRQGIAIIPAHGGKPVRRLLIPIMEWQRVQWSADAGALTYIDTAKGVSNIWSYDLNTGSSKQLTSFMTDEMFSYAWSSDYKQFACERGTRANDVTIITDQQ
jgi:serine/threonine protein kinase/Tol biopolymer transport system component